MYPAVTNYHPSCILIINRLLLVFILMISVYPFLVWFIIICWPTSQQRNFTQYWYFCCRCVTVTGIAQFAPKQLRHLVLTLLNVYFSSTLTTWSYSSFTYPIHVRLQCQYLLQELHAQCTMPVLKSGDHTSVTSTDLFPYYALYSRFLESFTSINIL